MRHITSLGCAFALLLGASAEAATTFLPGLLKREIWAGATRAQVNAGTLPASTNISYPTEWDVPDTGTDNYASRNTGWIVPAATGLYDFYLAVDDSGDLYLSTDDTAANKRLIAQENSWSGRRVWVGSTASINSQKTSVTWTNAQGVAPFASGIQLTAGQRYYMEVAHQEGGGGDFVGVTMVQQGSVVTDNEATTLTGNQIGLLITTPTALSFTTHPSNTTAFVGTSARFRVVTSTDSEIPPTYQWRRNGVNIPGATGPAYTLVVSAIDNAATFDCVAQVPGGLAAVTSSSATLTVPATGGLTVTGRLKREVVTAFTSNVRTNIRDGNVRGGTVTSVTSFDVGSAGANYGERVNGFFTPAVTANYVFFLAADDDTDLYLSTDDQPANRRLIAQETVWSNNRNWITPGGASIATQKRSDFWVPNPDEPVDPAPYANGIPLTAGTRYYIEAIHRAGGGGNGVSVTALTTTQVGEGFPVDGEATTLTNAVISYVTTPPTSFQITVPPANVTQFEGLNWRFEVTAVTDSEVAPTYQWRRNGTPVPGANTRVLTGVSVFADSGHTFSVDVSVPGFTNYSSPTVTLTVQQGVFVEGSLKREIWETDTAPTTRANIGANVPGTFPEADSTVFVTSGFVVGSSGANNISRISGFFVPATTGLYVFYLAADDDCDLFLSTNDRAENKRLIAQETGWANPNSWLESGNVQQKRSDTWQNAAFESPWAAGIQLTAGTRYYIEAVLHEGGGGNHAAVNYKLIDEADPVNGSATRMTGARVGVLVPGATAIGFTQQPAAGVSAIPTQPVHLTANATNNGIIPTTYQWRRNGTAIPGAIYANYGFIASVGDNAAQFDVVATAPGTSLSLTSTVATVSVQAGGTLVTGSLQREHWNGTGLTAELIRQGGAGPAVTNETVTSLQVGELGNAYVQRLRGFFTPTVTTNYVFFVNSDDDSYLYLGTNDDPATKRLIAQEQNWSNPLEWVTSGGGSSLSQKRSDQWVPDPGNPPAEGAPYANGIPLVAGTRYYIEVVHREGDGGDNVAATFVFHDPLAPGSTDPLTADPSALTGNLIGHLAAPAGRVITAVRNGNNLDVSWSPTGGTLQSTPALQGNGTVWGNVGTANPASVPIGAGNLFLRVVE